MIKQNYFLNHLSLFDICGVKYEKKLIWHLADFPDLGQVTVMLEMTSVSK